MTAASDVAILSRIIEPDRPALPASVAHMILRWEFREADRHRMHVLLEKAKEGALSRAEKKEAENYERIGHFLSMLKSKARVSLKAKRTAS